MRTQSTAITIFVLIACELAPARILPPVDAGTIAAADAGPVVCTLTVTPDDATVLGLRDDADPAIAGFQLALEAHCEPGISIRAAGVEAVAGAGGTARLVITLAHGSHPLTVVAGAASLQRTYRVDLQPPSAELVVPEGLQRLLRISGGSCADADGVGSDAVDQAVLQIADREPEPLTDLDAFTVERADLPPGDHQIRLTLSDEAGNQTVLQAIARIGLRKIAFEAPQAAAGRPCAGDFNGDGLSDIALTFQSIRPGLTPGSARIYFGAQELAEMATRRLVTAHTAATDCVMAPLNAVVGDELLLAVGSGLNRDHNRAQIQTYTNDAGDGPLVVHYRLNTGSGMSGQIYPSIALFPAGMRPADGAPEAAVVVKVGLRFLKVFDAARFAAAGSGTVDDPPHSLIQTVETGTSYRMATGALARPGGVGLAIGLPPFDSGAGGLWVFTGPFSTAMSLVLNGQNIAVRGAEVAEGLGGHLTAARYDSDAIDDLFVSAQDQRTVYVFRGGDEGGRSTALSLPEGAGPIVDMDACDLDGDGRAEISIVDELGLLIRWSRDQSWTRPSLDGSGPATFIRCAGDLDGDGHLDLVMISDRASDRVSLLH